ncbi:MAG: GNAT family N-acetyltransferase [Candidatus Dormibacteraceae bacterium]
MGPDADLLEVRLARGCRCFAAFVDGAVAGYGWLSTAPEWIGEIQLEITPRPGEGYIWNCVTVLEHRRKGVFRSMVMAIAAAGHMDGLERIWIGSVAIPAERAVGPAGFKPALHLHTAVKAGMCWLKVLAPVDTDPALVDAAREALAIGGRPLRLATTLRRSRPRRH